MKLEEMQALHAEVWQLRRDIAASWPTPPTLDCLRFAFTEIGEALDAYLRVQGGYARNHAKEPDLFGELADTALMLLTAYGPEHVIDHWASHVPPTLEAIACEIGDVLWYYDDAEHKAKSYHQSMVESMIGGALFAIADYPEMDLALELRKRMAKLRAKWGPQEQKA